jgi:hypothetical protein
MLALRSGCGLDMGADQYHEVKQIIFDQKTYYLYQKTTGFQEKMHFFNLYDKSPVFDDCRNTTQEPFAETDYVREEGIPVGFYVSPSPRGWIMEVEYSNAKTDALPLTEALDKADIVFKAGENHEIKHVVTHQKTYYLYLQTSPLKSQSFFVLYDQKPSFDAYGRASRDAIGYDVVWPDWKTPVKIILSDAPDELKVEYIENTGSHKSTLLEAGANIEIVIKEKE